MPAGQRVVLRANRGASSRPGSRRRRAARPSERDDGVSRSPSGARVASKRATQEESTATAVNSRPESGRFWMGRRINPRHVFRVFDRLQRQRLTCLEAARHRRTRSDISRLWPRSWSSRGGGRFRIQAAPRGRALRALVLAIVAARGNIRHTPVVRNHLWDDETLATLRRRPKRGGSLQADPGVVADPPWHRLTHLVRGFA